MQDQLVRNIAIDADLSERGVRRLLHSLRVPLGSDEGESPLEIGLNVATVYRSMPVNDFMINQLGAVLREYRNSCPRVVQWVGRGDFVPEQCGQFKKSAIVHAARTASRLRAALLRALPAPLAD